MFFKYESGLHLEEKKRKEIVYPLYESGLHLEEKKRKINKLHINVTITIIKRIYK